MSTNSPEPSAPISNENGLSARVTSPFKPNIRETVAAIVLLLGAAALYAGKAPEQRGTGSDTELPPSAPRAFLDGETGESTANLLRLEKASIDSKNARFSQMAPFLDR